MCPDQQTGSVETKPESFLLAGGPGTVVLVEDVRQILGWNSGALVGVPTPRYAILEPSRL